MWLQYVSHKVGRLVVPWALVALFASSARAGARQRPVSSRAALRRRACFYGLALAGALFQRASASAAIAFTFVMMNFSAVAGLAALRRGREVWR